MENNLVNCERYLKAVDEKVAGATGGNEEVGDWDHDVHVVTPGGLDV